MPLPPDFKDKMVKVVLRIPHGKVASYSQVAALIGSPRWARQVGQALRNYRGKKTIPWWRVINSRGFISIGGDPLRPELQKKLLLKEGVEFSNEGRISKNHFVSIDTL